MNAKEVQKWQKKNAPILRGLKIASEYSNSQTFANLPYTKLLALLAVPTEERQDFIEAKEKLQHGEWLPWLEKEVEFSERAAQSFMQLAKEYSNPHSGADLPYKKMLALLAVPAEERQDFIEAKEKLQHGEWLPWLEKEIEFSERTAQNFMQLAKEYSNPQPVADLPYRKLLALLAVPAEERQDFIEAKEKLQHGEWMEWLEKEVEFSQRTANNFMQLAREYSNSQPVSNLPYRKLLTLLAVPTEERQDFIEAKEKLQHGEWLPWLEKEVELSERTAQKFMQLAKEYSNTPPGADLPYKKMLALLAVPAEERQDFIETKHEVAGIAKAVVHEC